MKPVKIIRIDNEVWKALQRLVKEPFEDTPNAVLRRVLALDPPSEGEPNEPEESSSDPMEGGAYDRSENARFFNCLKDGKWHSKKELFALMPSHISNVANRWFWFGKNGKDPHRWNRKGIRWEIEKKAERGEEWFRMIVHLKEKAA